MATNVWFIDAEITESVREGLRKHGFNACNELVLVTVSPCPPFVRELAERHGDIVVVGPGLWTNDEATVKALKEVGAKAVLRWPSGAQGPLEGEPLGEALGEMLNEVLR